MMVVSGCRSSQQARPDHPYVASGVAMSDVTFHSSALNRDMPYRVFLPLHVEAGERLPVVYLLHGGNGGFRDWSNDSRVSEYAAQGLILVMSEGEFSYYMNSAERPEDKFEDYTFIDLVSDVEARFPVAKTREKRAIIGISMGGFAALKIAFTKPELFGFVAAFSPSIDIVHRHFNIRRWGEWTRIGRIFGPWGSAQRDSRDPLKLVLSADPAKTPYIYLTAGENEPLLEPNRRFVGRLEERHFQFEFHTQPGGHDWNEWNRQMPGCFQSLFGHVALTKNTLGPENH